MMMHGLCPAEDAASLQAPALCMSEHIALGAFSPGSGRLIWSLLQATASCMQHRYTAEATA